MRNEPVRLFLILIALCLMNSKFNAQTANILKMSIYEFENDEHLSIQHFDSAGNCVKAFEYYDDYLCEINYYKYDAQNRKTEHVSKDSTREDQSVRSTITYTYKPINKLKIRVSERSDDYLSLVKVDEYNKKGLLIKSISKNPSSKEKLQEIFTYDVLGRIVFNTATKGNKPWMTEEYKYNNQGFVSYYRRVYHDSDTLNEFISYYEYPVIDERGNWILRRYSHNNKEFSDELKREIEYRQLSN